MGTCANAPGGWCDDGQCVTSGCKLRTSKELIARLWDCHSIFDGDGNGCMDREAFEAAIREMNACPLCDDKGKYAVSGTVVECLCQRAAPEPPAPASKALLDALLQIAARHPYNKALSAAEACVVARNALDSTHEPSVPTQPPPAEHRETAWLVEALHAKPPRWAADITIAGTTWTHDANCALRFSRSEDAEKLAGHVTHFEGRWIIAPTEHVWCEIRRLYRRAGDGL